MSSYRYTMDFTYCHKEGKKILNYKYDSTNITGCIIHSDYIHNNMPIIILDICIPSTVANILVDPTNILNDSIIFNINKIDIEDELGIELPYIQGKFNYYTFEPINKNANLEYDTDRNPNDPDTLTRALKIGLIMKDMINANNVAVNGVIKGSTMQDVVQYCLNQTNMKTLVEQFDYNTQLKQVIVPPLNSLSKLVSFLNDVSVFYNTQYRFFIDFDLIYLISSSGNAIAKKTEKITSIMFDISDVDDIDPKNAENMTILTKQKLYYIPITFYDCQLADNYMISQQYNSIATIGDNTSGGSAIDIKTGSNSVSSVKNIRINNNNLKMLENIASSIANSNTLVSLFKVGADNSIFTPNKTYRIKYNNTYDESHNGSYLLNTKQEVFTREGPVFASATMLSLAKIGS